MSYKLHSNTLPEDDFRRVAQDQLEKAIAEIDDPSLDDDTTIHQIRKRCKKIRALARLYREPLGPHYKAINAYYRDLADMLSTGRDMKAMVEAYDDLMDTFADTVERGSFAGIRGHFTRAKQAAQRQGHPPADLLAEARRRLEAGRAALADISFAGKYARKPEAAAAKGLKTTYKRARASMAVAYATGRGEDFHEWRKRAKYHGYQARLARGYWPHAMGPRAGIAKSLGDVLGKDHDLTVMQHALHSEPKDIVPPDRLAVFRDLIGRRQRMLRERAALLGAMLFLEKTSSAVSRMRADDTFVPAVDPGD